MIYIKNIFINMVTVTSGKAVRNAYHTVITNKVDIRVIEHRFEEKVML